MEIDLAKRRFTDQDIRVRIAAVLISVFVLGAGVAAMRTKPAAGIVAIAIVLGWTQLAGL